MRVLENGEAAQNLARGQHLAADAANHMLQADPVRVRVIALRSGELAQADRHHLK